MWCPLLTQKEEKKKKKKTLVSDTVQIISAQPSCGLCGGSITFKLRHYSPGSQRTGWLTIQSSIISNTAKGEFNGLFDWEKKYINLLFSS